MVSEAGLKKFKKLYQKEFGVELGDHELEKAANTLLRLYRNIYRPNNIMNIKQDHEKLRHKKNQK